MKADHYDLSVWPADNRLDMQLRGFWTGTIARAFAADLDRSLGEMRAGGAIDGRMRSLLDMAELSILSTGLTPVFRDFATDQARTCDRVAVAYASTLALLQLKRLTAGERQFQFFRSVAEAEAWLAD